MKKNVSILVLVGILCLLFLMWPEGLTNDEAVSTDDVVPKDDINPKDDTDDADDNLTNTIPSVHAYPTMTLPYESYVIGTDREIPLIRQTYEDSIVQPYNETNNEYEIVSVYSVIDPTYTDEIVTTCVKKDYLPQSGITDPNAYYRVCRESMA